MKTKNKSKVNIPVPLLIGVIAVAVVISLIVIGVSNDKPKQQAYSFGKEVAQGIDVSEHNGEIDWEMVKETQDFAFIRVGYRGYGNGEIVEDKYARENLKNAEKAGIPVGVYFYTQALDEKEAEKEADFVYSIIKKYKVDLPVIIDFEFPVDSDGNAVGRMNDVDNDREKNTEIINTFIKKIQERGYIGGVYGSSSVLHREINMKSLDRQAFVWVADYNDRVTFNVDYTVWQYTETGKCDGVSSKYVDLNYWYQ